MKYRLFVWGLTLLLVAACFAAGAETRLTAGDMIVFGRYEQDGNLNNGPEPILWEVAEVDWQTGTLTAISRYLLDCVQYHTSTETVSWKDTYLNRWLQYSFAPSAFNAREQAALAPAYVSGAWESVFIPSEQEFRRFLGYRTLCEPTAYAVRRGVYTAWYQGKVFGSYWLRRSVSSVWGTFVGAHGGIYNQQNNKVTVRDNGVRPAVRLSLDYFAD